MPTSRNTWRGKAFLLRVDQKRIGVPLNRRVKIGLAKTLGLAVVLIILMIVIAYQLAGYSASLAQTGYDLYAQGAYEKSVENYEKSLQLNPNNAENWNTMGVAYFNLGKYSDALYSFNKAISLSPDGMVFWYNKGNSLKMLGRTAESDRAFSNAKELV